MMDTPTLQSFYESVKCPTAFPDTFKDFFQTLNEDDDSVDLLTTMLEDKLIPRSDTISESTRNREGDDVMKRSCRRGMSAKHYKRRTSEIQTKIIEDSHEKELQSKKIENNNSSITRRRSSDHQSRIPNQNDFIMKTTNDNAVNRRRSSSIAASRTPPDLHKFLQTEQNRPRGYLNTGAPPTRVHLSPNHNSSVISPGSVSPTFCAARLRLSPGTSPCSRDVSLSPRRGLPPSLEHQHRTRSRTASMPLVPRHRPTLAETRRYALKGAESEENIEYYRCRSFSITANGIFNLGDSLKSRRSRSINSVTSTGTSCSSGNSGNKCRDRGHSNASQNSTMLNVEAESEVLSYKVGMLGASGVGKTALTYQFTTSEYICAYDASLDEEYGQKAVSVMLDGQETELEIIDHPSAEMSVESFCATYNVDVFVVVYSVVDRKSLKSAEETLLYLWKSDCMSTKAVILVGNKADLERKREVPMAVGRRLANSCGCKFIETSSGLDHNVDELLVGILAQVKLNPRRNRDTVTRKRKIHISSGRRILSHLLGFKRKTRSCENLLVL